MPGYAGGTIISGEVLFGNCWCRQKVVLMVFLVLLLISICPHLFISRTVLFPTQLPKKKPASNISNHYSLLLNKKLLSQIYQWVLYSHTAQRGFRKSFWNSSNWHNHRIFNVKCILLPLTSLSFINIPGISCTVWIISKTKNLSLPYTTWDFM